MFMRIENALYNVMATGNQFVPYRLVKRLEAATSVWAEQPFESEPPIQLYRHRTDENRLFGYLKQRPVFFVEDGPSRLRRIDL